MHNDPQNSGGLPLPFPDALQEFRVATSGLSAQSGMHSGASVNAVTKSGTNRYSGNLFEFVRDKRFNAKSPFAPIGPDGKRRDDGLKRNQFGGTLGGPIVHDRMFFFAALPGHEDAGDARRHARARADRRDAGGRLHRLRLTGVQRGTPGQPGGGLRGESNRPGAIQSRRAEPRQAAAHDDGPVRRDALRFARRPR